MPRSCVKLNGGLGTSMGMRGPKSLLEVHDGLSFLDVIAKQVLAVRDGLGVRLPLLLMNSFRTRDESLEALSAYPDLPSWPICRSTSCRTASPSCSRTTSLRWSGRKTPSLEWCPPGHGDLYTALYGSGLLRRLLDEGLRYAFVSNGDNLGATADARVAGWFAEQRCALRRRGLPPDSRPTARAVRSTVRRSDGRLVLRDTAQTAPEDADAFADETRHRFFHSNNLWFDLRALAAELEKRDGVLGLPAHPQREDSRSWRQVVAARHPDRDSHGCGHRAVRRGPGSRGRTRQVPAREVDQRPPRAALRRVPAHGRILRRPRIRP